MSRRVERLLTRRTAGRTPTAPPTLNWSGTFHSVGARLLREYAGRIGLDPTFTIHDRQDSGDLINLVRNELGLLNQEQTLSPESDLPGNLLGDGQHPVAPARGATNQLSLVCRMGKRSEAAISCLRRSQAGATGARLRRSVALLGADGRRSGARGANSASASGMCWSTSIRTPIACRQRFCWP
jgi:hypothetical protein